MELFRSIKVRTETPVRLVFYPGEGHGNRKAAAQYDYSLRLMRWMDTYLNADATVKTPMPEFDLGMADRLKNVHPYRLHTIVNFMRLKFRLKQFIVY